MYPCEYLCVALYLCVTELEHMRPGPKLQCSALGCGPSSHTHTYWQSHEKASDAEKTFPITVIEKSRHRDYRVK